MLDTAVVLQFAQKLDAISPSPILIALESSLRQDPDQHVDGNTLKEAVSEFFKAFSHATTIEVSLGKYYIPNVTTHTKDIRTKTELLEFLAVHPQLCEIIATQYDRDIFPTLVPFGLNKDIIKTAATEGNVAFFVLSLQLLNFAASTLNGFHLWNDAYASILQLTKNGADVSPVIDYLNDYKDKLPELSLRWTNFEGRLLTEIREIQAKNQKGLFFNPSNRPCGCNATATIAQDLDAVVEERERNLFRAK